MKDSFLVISSLVKLPQVVTITAVVRVKLSLVSSSSFLVKFLSPHSQVVVLESVELFPGSGSSATSSQLRVLVIQSCIDTM